MNAQQRAARVRADIERSRAAASGARGAGLQALGVYVKGNEVRKLGVFGGGGRHLGSLVGACAGVMDVRPASAGQMVNSLVTGIVPRVGTVFVAFADGTRFETKLLQGSPKQMRDVDAQIARFNTMADLATAADGQ